MEAALAQVQALADKEHVDPMVLVAQVEHLADLASATSHAQAELYQKTWKRCRDQEKSKRVKSLVIRLVGTEVQKKVLAAEEAWRKAEGKNLKSGGEGSPDSKKDDARQTQQAQAMAMMSTFPGMPNFGNPWAMWGPPPGMMMAMAMVR